MDTDKENKIIDTLIHKELSEKIISAFLKVYNILGYGFLEKVYENALIIELRNNGLEVVNQYPTPVYYLHKKVGDYYADLLIDDKIIVELKAVENLLKEHECQLITYLKATKYEVGLLLNFGKKPEIKRRVYTNDLKENYFN